MRNQKSIDALEKIINDFDYHFSNFDIQNILSERRNKLIDVYGIFVRELQEILREDRIDEISNFTKKFVVDLETGLYFKEEYEILILKLNEISYWILGNNFPQDHYKENNHKFRYRQ